MWRGPATLAALRRCGCVITSTGLWDDRDFSPWYPRDGRPGLSPAQLAMVCVLQFLLNLSDRQAAEAVRCRIDFKYALALELDDPGFHHSVLTDFRDRLCKDDRADRLLSLSLAQMRDAGVITERGRQRTDSTQVLAAARDLSRLELVLEAIRAALEEAAQRAPDILDGLVDAEWATRYGRPVRLPSQPSHPATRLTQAGADARRLLERLPPHRRGPARKRCGRSSCRTSSSTPWRVASPHREGRAAQRRCADRLALRPRSPTGHPGQHTLERLSGPCHRDLRDRFPGQPDNGHRHHQADPGHRGPPRNPRPAE